MVVFSPGTRFDSGVAAGRGKVDLVHFQLAWRGSAYRKLIIAGYSALFWGALCRAPSAGQFDQFWAGAGTYLRRSINRPFRG